MYVGMVRLISWGFSFFFNTYLHHSYVYEADEDGGCGSGASREYERPSGVLGLGLSS